MTTMKIFRCALISGSLFIAALAFAQHIDTGYEVGTWQGFRQGAISYTFDDNCANQFVVAIPMFNEYGFKLTLFPVIDWCGGYWTQMQAAATQGHEIGSHTVTHINLSQNVTDSVQRVEQANAKSEIERRITGQKCITIAYPYCAIGNTAITAQYYMAARTCSGQINYKTPSDFMMISSYLCGNLTSLNTSQAFNQQANSAATVNGWLVYLFHGIDNDGGYSPVTTDVLRGSLAYLDTNRTKFWVAPFGTVARYIKERNAVSVAQTSASDSIVTVNVTDTLDNTIYNVPVTVRRELPTGWLSATGTQNGNPVPAEVVTVNSKKYIVFDAVPNGGEVRLTIAQPTGINYSEPPSATKPTLMQNYPNPISVSGASGQPGTTVSFNLPSRSHVSLKVYDTIGREVSTLISGELSAGTYKTQLNTGGLPSGVYFYRLVAGDVNETRSFVLVR